MTRREYFHHVMKFHSEEMINKMSWARIYSHYYYLNTNVNINLIIYKKYLTKFYNFALKHSLSFLRNNLFDIRENKIIPMIDCKNYSPATIQNPEIFGELI